MISKSQFLKINQKLLIQKLKQLHFKNKLTLKIIQFLNKKLSSNHQYLNYKNQKNKDSHKNKKLQIKIYQQNLNQKFHHLKHYHINLDKKPIVYAVTLFVYVCIMQNQVQKYNKMILIIIFLLCLKFQIILLQFQVYKNLNEFQNKNQISKDIKVQEIEAENTQLKKENLNLKRCLKRFNVTSNLDAQKQQNQIQQLQDQLNDQQLLISEYFHKIKQYEQQSQCKQLNDFILKKRKIKNEQPVFNLELVKRKLTLDVCRSREESIYTVNEPRIHSKTIQHKY